MKHLIKLITALAFITSSCGVDSQTSSMKNIMDAANKYTYHPRNFEKDPRNQYTFLDWCEGTVPNPTFQERRTFVALFKDVRSQMNRRVTCEGMYEYLKTEMRDLNLNSEGLLDLSPLLILKEASKLLALTLDGQGIYASEVKILDFLDFIPSFRLLVLPLDETNKDAKCPLIIKEDTCV